MSVIAAGLCVDVSVPSVSVSVIAPSAKVDVHIPMTGPQGPPGPPSTSAYRHTQATPSTLWVVEHGLGYQPGGINVTNPSGDTYWPTVEHIDDNTAHLHLPESILGTARLS